MEVSLKKTGFHCFDKILSQKLKKEETQDTVVPDTMPDIAEILDTCGVFVIRSKEAAETGVKITGNIAANVLYKAEESGQLCSLDLSVPVDLSLDADLPEDDTECSAAIHVTSLEARALNPRKVLIKAEVCTQVDCFVPALTEYAEGLQEGEEGVYVQTKSAAFSPVTAVREKTFVLTDELVLPAVNAAAGELLSKSVSAVVEDIKTVGSKLVFKGCVNSSLLYRSTDGIPVTAEFTTGFSQIMECDASFQNAVAQIHVIPTGIYWELPAGGDGRSVHLEAHLLAQAVASERAELHYASDAYSNTYALQLQRQKHSLSCVMEQGVLKESLRELYETPVPVSEVVNARAAAGLASVQDGGIELPVWIHMLWKTVNGELCSANKKYKLLFRTETGEGESLCAGDCDLRELYVSPSGDGVEIRLHAQLQLLRSLTTPVEIVSAMERGEDMRDLSQLPSLVLIRADQNADLWQLAKENCSTVEQIMELNGLRDGGDDWDKYLLIPKMR